MKPEYATAGGIEPAQPAIVKAHQTFDMVDVLCDRIMQLASRLVGDQPSDAGASGAKLQPVRNGMLPELSDRAGRTAANIDGAFHQLDRLSSAL
jgi:hypothetical protein